MFNKAKGVNLVMISAFSPASYRKVLFPETKCLAEVV